MIPVYCADWSLEKVPSKAMTEAAMLTFMRRADKEGMTKISNVTHEVEGERPNGSEAERAFAEAQGRDLGMQYLHVYRALLR
jgi:hypothetical protein